MNNSDSERKIKKAAKTVFKQKGFKATRTRDIAECAGVNLALINYYFKNKQTLFEEVMFESMLTFVGTLTKSINDEATSIQEKLAAIVNNYFDLFQKDPELPMFIFNEIAKKNMLSVLQKQDVVDVLRESYLAKQLHEIGKSDYEIQQIFINTISLVVCPVLGRDIIQSIFGKEYDYNELLLKRKGEIPVWISSIFNL